MRRGASTPTCVTRRQLRCRSSRRFADTPLRRDPPKALRTDSACRPTPASHVPSAGASVRPASGSSRTHRRHPGPARRRDPGAGLRAPPPGGSGQLSREPQGPVCARSRPPRPTDPPAPARPGPHPATTPRPCGRCRPGETTSRRRRRRYCSRPGRTSGAFRSSVASRSSSAGEGKSAGGVGTSEQRRALERMSGEEGHAGHRGVDSRAGMIATKGGAVTRAVCCEPNGDHPRNQGSHRTREDRLGKRRRRGSPRRVGRHARSPRRRLVMAAMPQQRSLSSDDAQRGHGQKPSPVCAVPATHIPQ
jgi:hypothetical protein